MGELYVCVTHFLNRLFQSGSCLRLSHRTQDAMSVLEVVKPTSAATVIAIRLRRRALRPRTTLGEVVRRLGGVYPRFSSENGTTACYKRWQRCLINTVGGNHFYLYYGRSSRHLTATRVNFRRNGCIATQLTSTTTMAWWWAKRRAEK